MAEYKAQQLSQRVAVLFSCAKDLRLVQIHDILLSIGLSLDRVRSLQTLEQNQAILRFASKPKLSSSLRAAAQVFILDLLHK